jgi:hypothetical protein
VFLVLQLVLLINFVYEINEWLTGKDTRGAWATLVVGAVLALAAGVTAIAFAYYLYSARWVGGLARAAGSYVSMYE